MKFTINDNISKFTNNINEVTLEASTVRESLIALFNRFPQLYIEAVDNRNREESKIFLVLNDEDIISVEDLNKTLDSDDCISIEEAPSGKELFSLSSAIVMALEMATEFALPEIISTLAAALLTVGMVVGISVLASALAGGPPTPDGLGNLNDSSTYTFNGIQNTTASGTPVPIVYGTHRVGGQYINVYTEAGIDSSLINDSGLDMNQTELYAQIGLCEGEIEDLLDIEINKLPENYFSYIDIDKSAKGTSDQSPLPYFGRTQNTVPSGRKALYVSGTNIDKVSTTYVETPIYGYSIPNELGISYSWSGAIGGSFTYDEIGSIQPTTGTNHHPRIITEVYGNFSFVTDAWYDYDSGSYYRTYARWEQSESPDHIINWNDRDTRIPLSTGTTTRVNVGGQLYLRSYDTNLSVNFSADEYTKLQTSKAVNSFSVTLVAPAMYYANPTKGMENTSVELILIYRALGEEIWNIQEVGFVMQGKQRSELIRTIKFPSNLPLAIYEIAVLRVTEDHSGSFEYVDDVYVKEVNEIVNGTLAYPCTAMVGIKVRATDQLSGSLPTITTVVKGAKVSVPITTYIPHSENYTFLGNSIAKSYKIIDPSAIWNGAMSWDEDTQEGYKEWSDNPVWCLYDLLTNKRYGLGDYYKIDPAKRGLMLANFYSMAKYCDELVEFTAEDNTVVQRKRFSLDIVIDQSRSATEWVLVIATVMRATCFYSEGLFWIDIDRPKPVTKIFNMSNIAEFSQSGASYKDVPNVYEVTYPNPFARYDMDLFRVESNEFVTNGSIEERKKALTLVGITDFEHAKSHAKYALVAGQLLTKTISFKTDASGLRCMPTDVIGVQHDLPQWGWGGHVTGYNSVTKTISLNCTFSPVVSHVDSGETVANKYFIQLSHKGETPVSMELEGTWDGNERATAKLKYTPEFNPENGDLFVIGEQTNKIVPFKVLSIKRDDDELCEVTAINYDDRVYSLADNTAGLGVIQPKNYSMLSRSRVSVQGVIITDKMYTDTDNSIKVGVDLTYSKPIDSSYWSGVILNYGIVGTNQYYRLPINTTGFISITNIIPDKEYQFVLTSVYTDGLVQSVEEALSNSINKPFITHTVRSEVSNTLFLSGVTGLQIVNSGNGELFLGKDCFITWRKPAPIDFAGNIVTENTISSAGGVSGWLSGYLVEIINLEGTIRRSEMVSTENYVYTHEMNDKDGPIVRAFTVRVTAYDKVGRPSNSSSITISNPAPQTIS